MKQAIAWWCLARSGLTLPQLVDVAVEVGYAGIEMAEPHDWPLVRQRGLTVVSTQGHASIAAGLNRRTEHARIEREIRAKLQQAREWDIPCLICFSGNREGLDDEQGLENTIIGLRRVAPAAEEAGVTLVLELLNSRVDHPDYQCDRTDWGVRVCQAVASPRVKLLYDIYHMQIMEGDIIRTIQQHQAWIGYYHTAGNPGRHELDDRQELNYPAIMQAIAATGYTGWIGQEFVPRGEPVAALRDAFQRCQVTND